MQKKIVKIVGVLFIAALVYAIYNQYPRLHIVAGYSAKNMSSSVFLANRGVEFTDQNDNNFSPIDLASDQVDRQEKSASASVYGLLNRKAIYREGLGSVLVTKNYKKEASYAKPIRTKIKTELPYPFGHLQAKDTLFKHIDYAKLKGAANTIFDSISKTRAVLILHKDHLIFEQYADGFDKESILLGWSMTKSITGTIFGILQHQGTLKIEDKAPINSWQNSSRSEITIGQLLEMNSGLEWVEDYNTISDVTKMLFLAENMGKVQENKELIGTPHKSWNYSSGTSNLLSNIARSYFNSHQDYLDFWYGELIDKIGMHSMTVEADLDGNYVGSSYAWATARDWAKLGLLYLHNGLWNGQQVFDQYWTAYALHPTNGSNGQYGAHIWLNAGGFYPDAPKDLYSFNGYQGQRVFIIPSKELVIVRMGLKSIDFNAFLSSILSSIDEH